MPAEITNTIMLTTKCSAGCRHCPFSDPKLEKLFLIPKIIEKNLTLTTATISVLSGGEPFEHPEIAKILIDLRLQTNPFRIATGGFVDLSPWIHKIKDLVHPSSAFQGISVGTDVLSSRLDHSSYVSIWKNNIQLFCQHQIPYSLTFTVGNDLYFSHFNLWKWDCFFENKPQFIYLRVEKNLQKEWSQKVKNTFHDIPLIIDNDFYTS